MVRPPKDHTSMAPECDPKPPRDEAELDRLAIRAMEQRIATQETQRKVLPWVLAVAGILGGLAVFLLIPYIVVIFLMRAF